MPHPCALDETLDGCAELAAEHAAPVAEVVVPSLKEALVANAPAITARLDSALLKVGEWVEATESLATAEAPKLVNEIVYWGVAEPGFRVVIGLFFICFLPATLLYLRRDDALKDFDNKVAAALNENGSSGSFVISLIGVFVLPIVGVMTVFANTMQVLKPLVAPRLYLIEFFKGLMS